MSFGQNKLGSGRYNTSSKVENKFYFASYTRLKTNKAPSYKCGANISNGLIETTQSTEDKFSSSTTSGGNGQLTYPIALMTADEVSFAGGVYEVSLSVPYSYYFLNSNGSSITELNWWLLSSSDRTSSGSSVFYVQDSNYLGRLFSRFVSQAFAVRPVISLSSCIKVTGDGTPTDPYIVTKSSCN